MDHKHPTISRRQQQRLRRHIEAEIDRLGACLILVGTIHPEVFRAGAKVLGGEREFILWACEPARALGWRCPVAVAATEAGRATVINLLGAIEDGGFI